MAFLRLVEVFPPMYRMDGKERVDLAGLLDGLVSEVRAIRSVSDVILVSNHKNPAMVKLSSVDVAVALKEKAGVDAAPVLVARDMNRPQMASSIASAFSRGVSTIMFAWGDRYPPGGPRNVYDFHGLAEVISEARAIGSRLGLSPRILTPFDIRHLGQKDKDLAQSRLAAGADLLLAQPPTTDAEEVYDRHVRAIEEAGLRDKVLLNVFPFRDIPDIERVEKLFGWSLSDLLKTKAKSGEGALLEEARKTARRMKADGLAGAYVETRGKPAIALDILS